MFGEMMGQQSGQRMAAISALCQDNSKFNLYVFFSSRKSLLIIWILFSLFPILFKGYLKDQNLMCHVLVTFCSCQVWMLNVLCKISFKHLEIRGEYWRLVYVYVYTEKGQCRENEWSLNDVPHLWSTICDDYSKDWDAFEGQYLYSRIENSTKVIMRRHFGFC